MIRYLKQEEKIESRSLWEQVFPEDSQSFLDYYYSDRVRKNKILTAWKEDRVAAMLHRNPYQVVVKDRLWKADYIAGVATAPDCRHQGYMRRLLSRCFSDMYMERMGFCFLVPADPVIYSPFDFTYICDLPEVDFSEQGHGQLSRRAFLEGSEECREVGRFVGKQLEKKYEVYTLRDEAYYQDLSREVRSDRGDLILLFTREDRETLAGVWAYYGQEAANQRELVCIPPYIKETGPSKPAVMGRIIHLEQFVSVIRLKEECPVSELELLLEVTDDIIHQNAGVFRWRLGKEGSTLLPVKDGGGDLPQLSMGIQEMTSWLFGYDMPAVRKDKQSMVEWIRPLKGVFFDEIT